MTINRNTNQLAKMHVSGLANMSPKTMAAAVLMCTMVVLWGRVLLSGRNGPESAQAEESIVLEQAAAKTAPAGEMQFKGVELPFIEGRNDTLAADLFSLEQWTSYDFNRSGTPAAVQVDDGLEDSRHRSNLDALSKELLLEAVIRSADGSGMQAFIGGKVLIVGQVLTVSRQAQVYDLTLTEITPQEVTLAWKDYSIKVKITESHEQ